jgi:hypothetical protein
MIINYSDKHMSINIGDFVCYNTPYNLTIAIVVLDHNKLSFSKNNETKLYV